MGRRRKVRGGHSDVGRLRSGETGISESLSIGGCLCICSQFFPALGRLFNQPSQQPPVEWTRPTSEHPLGMQRVSSKQLLRPTHSSLETGYSRPRPLLHLDPLEEVTLTRTACAHSGAGQASRFLSPTSQLSRARDFSSPPGSSSLLPPSPFPFSKTPWS